MKNILAKTKYLFSFFLGLTMVIPPGLLNACLPTSSSIVVYGFQPLLDSTPINSTVVPKESTLVRDAQRMLLLRQLEEYSNEPTITPVVLPAIAAWPFVAWAGANIVVIGSFVAMSAVILIGGVVAFDFTWEDEFGDTPWDKLQQFLAGIELKLQELGAAANDLELQLLDAFAAGNTALEQAILAALDAIYDTMLYLERIRWAHEQGLIN